MSEQNNSQELANKLWAIANDLRSNMDSSKFKDYILGVIFYKYLSEKTEDFVAEILEDDGMTFEEALEDDEIRDEFIEEITDKFGFVIYPEHLWKNLIEKIKVKEFTIEDLERAIKSMMESTTGPAFEKLFDDMDLHDKDLGREVSDRTELMSKIMQRIDDISFNQDNAGFDVLGTAYMILIGLFASDAGKKGGEFYTPASVSKVLARLATSGLESAESVCDMCAGSGSLLLELREALPSHHVGHYYAQELNGSTYNLLRMNLILHGLDSRKFTTYNNDTIKNDKFHDDDNGEDLKFTVQVSNPPYSQKYDNNKNLLKDPRFSGAGVLAPKTKADMMFLEHMVSHMAEKGQAAIVLPHGVLFRGNAEETIRKYLIENLNVIDAVIGLPANLFHGTSIPVCIFVLKKTRNGNSDNILFINASQDFIKGKKQNSLSEEHIDKIIEAYEKREDIEKYSHVATMDEIRENDFNLNIPRYVDTFEEEEPINLNDVFENLQKIEVEEKEIDSKLKLFFNELGLDVIL